MKGTFLAMIVALLVPLISCGPQATSPTTPGVSTQVARTSVPAKPAWEQEWERTLALAKQEGKITLYTTAGAEVRQALSKGFKDRYGIEVEFVMGKGVELVQKILTERRAGLYLADLFMAGSTDVFFDLKPSGALDPLKPILILPEVLEPSVWLGGKPHFADKEGVYTVVFVMDTHLTVAINTDMAKSDEIKSYKDLLLSKWKGKLIVCDPTLPGGGLRWFGAVGSRVMGWDYMRELAKQDPVVLRDLRLAAEWVARGKNPAVIAPKRETIVEFQKAGAPVKFITNLEGNYLVGGAGTLSLLNRPPHDNATRVFVNWLLSREGQTAYSLAAFTQSARLDVPVDHLDPVWRRDPSVNYFVTEDEDFLLHQEEQMKLAKEIFGPLMK